MIVSRGMGATEDWGLFWTEKYPADMTFGQNVKCTIAPWTEECERLRQRAGLLEANIPAPAAPPRLPATPGAYTATRTDDPKSGQELSDAQIRAWQQQNLDFFKSINIVSPDGDGETNWLRWLLVGAGGLAVFGLFGRRRR